LKEKRQKAKKLEAGQGSEKAESEAKSEHKKPKASTKPDFVYKSGYT